MLFCCSCFHQQRRGLKITSFPCYWCWPYAGTATQSPAAAFVTRHIASLSLPAAIWFHIKRKMVGFSIHKSGPGKSSCISSSFSLQQSTLQRVLDLQPAPRPGKVSADAFASFIPHHVNHVTALLSAAGGTHLAAPTDTLSTGKTEYPAPDCSQ